MPHSSEKYIQIRTYSVSHPGRHTIHEHSHDWHQLIYPSEGVVIVHTGHGSWVVPPQRAVWVAAGTVHNMEMPGPVYMRTLYLKRGISKSLPEGCCVLNVAPLLRELIIHATSIGALDGTIPAQKRLTGIILDQLSELPTIPLQIPMPTDLRARRVAEILRAKLDVTMSLQQISRMVGASKRTIERLFLAETKMTFGRWRQQLRLMHALQLLAEGENVTNVALEVGYESTSAFIAVFKDAFGVTPSRYFKNA
jgi:AraC-like DNA-binding protein